MNNELAHMSKKKEQHDLLPRLRFPEFRGSQPWTAKTLDEYCERLTETVGDAQLTPVSITSGTGFVPQEEKFGRDISGAQYSNYIRIRRGDFAYNRGNSKRFPQGCVYQLTEFDEAAASNAFYCFRLQTGYHPAFFQGLFESNCHGRQLLKDITSSARSTGLLNIRADTFFGTKIPMPPKKTEHRKIADCLGSLDDLIAAEGRKLETLRDHKQGLIKQLFPREGETQPRLRFPEFRDAPAWEMAPLVELFETMTGGTPDRTNKEYWGGTVPWITTSLVDFNLISNAEQFITEAGLKDSSAKMFPRGTVLVALYGQGKTRGKVGILDIEASTNQACAAILPTPGFDPMFTFLSLSGRYDELRSLSNAGGQKNLSQGLIRELPFHYPADPAERETIAKCLSALDTRITAQAKKLGALRSHKRGLMQQLFPSVEDDA